VVQSSFPKTESTSHTGKPNLPLFSLMMYYQKGDCVSEVDLRQLKAEARKEVLEKLIPLQIQMPRLTYGDTHKWHDMTLQYLVDFWNFEKKFNAVMKELST
jgi:hypothetical protein